MSEPTLAPGYSYSGRPALVAVNAGHDVHVDTCWIARRHARSHGWAAIDYPSSADLAREAATSDLHICKKCKPISRLAWWERNNRSTAPAEALAERVRLHRFAALNEDTLQEALAALLGGRREVVLSAGGRVDLLVDDVAIEVKVAGSAEAVFRQVQGYARSVEVSELLVVTTRIAHLQLPTVASGKRLVVALAVGVL